MAREQSHHNVFGISTDISTVVGNTLSTHSTARTVRKVVLPEL